MNVKAGSNPFETSFENLTTKAGGAAKKVVKAAGDAAGTLTADVKQQVTGDYSKSLVEEVNLQKVNPLQQQQLQQQQQQNLSQTRANLEQINQAIKRARDERMKKQAEQVKQVEQAKQVKKMEEQKKAQEPAWKKMLKGKMGSREMAKNAGG